MMPLPLLAQAADTWPPEVHDLANRTHAWLGARLDAPTVLQLGATADQSLERLLVRRGIDVTVVDPGIQSEHDLPDGRLTHVTTSFDQLPEGSWPQVAVPTATERCRTLAALLGAAVGRLAPDGGLLLTMDLGLSDGGLPWLTSRRLSGLGDGVALTLADEDLFMAPGRGRCLWVSEWVVGPRSSGFADRLLVATGRALARTADEAAGQSAVAGQGAERDARLRKELQVLRASAAGVDKRVADERSRGEAREAGARAARDRERKLRQEALRELRRLRSAQPAPVVAGPPAVLPAMPPSSLPSGLRIGVTGPRAAAWAGDWVQAVPLSGPGLATGDALVDAVDAVVVCGDDGPPKGLAADQTLELVTAVRAAGLPVIDVRDSGVPTLWDGLADVVLDPEGRADQRGGLSAVPPVDVSTVNPQGFRYTCEDTVAVCPTAPALTSVLEACRQLVAPMPLEICPSAQPATLRRHRGVVDHEDLHDDDASRATALIRLCAAGVPVVTAGLNAGVKRLLGPALSAVLEQAGPAILTDCDDRERHSVRLRRAALRDHSSQARWRALSRELALHVPRPVSVTMLMATNRPDFLEHSLRQMSGIDYPWLELVVALHGDAFPQNVQETIDSGFAGPCQVVRVDTRVTLGDALNAAVDAASGDLVTKVDDDDWYGAEHVWDLVLAHEYSGAELVAKGAEFVYLAQLDITLRRFAEGAERSTRTVAGGTLLMARSALRSLGGWRRVRRSVDQSLIEDVERSGGRAYRTHGHGYLLNRHGRGHTWDPSVDYFLEQSTRQWRGLALDKASVGPPPR